MIDLLRRALLCATMCFAICLTLETSALSEEQKFGGIGLQVVPTIQGELVVLNVIEKTPADLEGLKPGDLIVQVDNVPLLGSDFGKIVSEKLWGPVGTDVTLFYLRPGVRGKNKVTLQRIPLDPRLTVSPTAGDASPTGSEN